MRFVDEYRDEDTSKRWLDAIHSIEHEPVVLMEICGGQTHTIMKYGLDELLGDKIELVHGPGCPVCVTPISLIDQALEIAKRPEVIFTSFGDMLRVPGSKEDLLSVKARGADVRMVYSPMDALQLAIDNPDREVVFFAVGFETTTPANAMSVYQAKEKGVKNYSILTSHVLVPPAMEAILGAENNRVQGFLAAGHVCTVMGYWEYEPVAKKYKIPMVVAGFEPVDILRGVYKTVKMLSLGEHGVVNAYERVVTREGNKHAQALVNKVFDVCDRPWRGIGTIPQSGLQLSKEYAAYDGATKFEVDEIVTRESALCIAGSILQGRAKPNECPAFGKECTPETPLGAPMVSTEGACSAYFNFGRGLE
ncbi:hydrogenase formation protein HypD [Myxococcota bacterium]|nr:hydrogenase formation protein HypD [Myxococcota bacterium]